jgi:3-oxoadipate enol-lactonase
MMLHHQIDGQEDARPLLLGGSLGTTLDMWERQLPLSEHFRLIRFDHRGHGRSPVPTPPSEIADLGLDVLALMDALELARASYCGLSIGGMVGLWLAGNAPERIERLVLMCTSADTGAPETWRRRSRTVLEAGSVDVVADDVVDRWLTPDGFAQNPSLRAELRAMLAACDPDGYAGCCRAIERMNLTEEVRRVRAPTLVVSGSHDRATPPEHQRRIADAIPGARYEIIAPAAHLAPVEQPDAVNRLIREHLT